MRIGRLAVVLWSFRQLTGSDAEHAAWMRFREMTAAFARQVFPTLTEPVPSRDEVRRLVAAVPGAWETFATAVAQVLSSRQRPEWARS